MKKMTKEKIKKQNKAIDIISVILLILYILLDIVYIHTTDKILGDAYIGIHIALLITILIIIYIVIRVVITSIFKLYNHKYRKRK